ncbi:hypothetical protein G7046_g7766 [Stylonectria norvegica]|nr:hypothetical protein G7046_g7766 [Stylonectria norvegica]
MASDGFGFNASGSFEPQRPSFHIGQHDSHREAPLTDVQYGHLLNHGLSFVTTPITNGHFRERVFGLIAAHLATLDEAGEKGTTRATSSRAEPILPPLTPKDTSLFPSAAVNTYTACISPWIDLSSADPVIANISRQVLNIEINYANFCGVRSILIQGPQQDASRNGGNQGLGQYARAIEEALNVGNRLNFLIHMPMYREPGLESSVETLSTLRPGEVAKDGKKEIDLFTAWDTWHQIRTVCNYNTRLFVALQIPKVMPEKDLQNRWFAEPMHYLSLSPSVFQTNKSGFPCLSKPQQELIFTYMRLKNSPWILLTDAGPDVSQVKDPASEGQDAPTADEFPTLGEAQNQPSQSQRTSHARAVDARGRHLDQFPRLAAIAPAAPIRQS